MKTRELIKFLQAADPEGKMEVLICVRPTRTSYGDRIEPIDVVRELVKGDGKLYICDSAIPRAGA